MTRVLALVLAMAALLLPGCPSRGGGDAEKPAELFSEKKFLSSCGAKKQFGESCTECGDRECAEKGAICLHVQPEPEEGWVCSRQCTVDEDCGLTGWTCRAVFSDTVEGEGYQYCVPRIAPL